MSYSLTMIERESYLHIKVVGENSPKSVRCYTADVMRECHERKYSHVLIEENLEGPSLGIVDIYNIVSEKSIDAGQMPWIAYVDVNNEHDMSRMKFAETVGVNRGIKVQLFSTVEAAEKWLRELMRQLT